jgi:surface antigen
MRTPKALVAAALALSLGACESMGQHETSGTLIGGALGALIGSQFGGDTSDRVLAAGLGAALGGYVGNRIGRSMDERDRMEHDRAAQRALWDNGSGRPYAWTGQEASGQVLPRGDSYRDRDGRLCRPFTDTVTFRDGYRRSVEGTACLSRDGRWVVVG